MVKISWFFIFLLNHIHLIDGLVCYSCTSTLSSTVDEAGQLALRIFLDSTYLLPSVHKLCNMEDDMDFKTIPVSQCPYKDNCVKISASNQGISFVIRGCESQVYRPSTKSQDIPCTSNSPSVCRCPETLCNNSIQNFYSFILLLLAIVFNIVSRQIKKG